MKKLILGYFLANFLSIVFGMATYSLIIPLLKVLFNQADIHDLLLSPQLPNITWQGYLIQYKRTMYGCLMQMLNQYGKIGLLFLLSCLFTFCNLVSNCFRYLADIAMDKVRLQLISNLRLALFKKILTFPPAYFTATHKSDLIARTTTDLQEIENGVADGLRLFLKEPTQLICYIILLCTMSFKLTLYMLFFLPLAGSFIAYIIKSIQKWGHKSKQALDHLIHMLEEALIGMQVIKLFGAQKYMFDKFKQINEYYTQTTLSMMYKEAMTSPISTSLSVGVVSIILSYGGQLALLGDQALTASTFITYIVVCSQALIPIKMASRAIGHIQQGIVSGDRILDLLDTKTSFFEQKNNINDHILTEFKKEIMFKQVSFSYDGQNMVLDNISLTVHKGQTLALVGPSGSGKSTLLALLARLYQPNSGEITIDGLPLNRLHRSSIPNLMGVVPQDPILFHDTIFNNILLNRSPTSSLSVKKSAQAVGADSFIMEQPQTYEAEIGAGGNKLSGGQKQRICMARAILNHPSILLLDEATSALDIASEQLLQEQVRKLIPNLTYIISAHRLSTIRHADQIIVLDKGRIVEQGNHTELLAQGGIYKTLFQLQNNGNRASQSPSYNQ